METLPSSSCLTKINKYNIICKKRKEGKNMPEWTKEQKQAIEEKGSNLLVAAAARKWKNSSTC